MKRIGSLVRGMGYLRTHQGNPWSAIRIRVTSCLVFALIILVCSLPSVAATETYTPGKTADRTFDSFARSFLASNCLDCHGKTEPEADLSLHGLGPVDEVNAGIWRSVWAVGPF